MEKQKQLLAGLAHIRKRPHMYFSDEVPAVVNFLEGFKMACLMLNPTSKYDSVYQRVIQNRGWKVSAQGIWGQMKDRGLDSETVIAEMLAIHQEVWEQLISETEATANNKV